MDHRYFYEGPVLEFGRLVAEHWRGETIASSKRKARSNLAYQFKQATNRTPRTKIIVPGELEIID